MFSKSRIIGLLAITIVGFLILRTGDESADSRERGGDSGSATERQLQPREPAFLRPDREYGIAGRFDAGGAPSPYGREGGYPETGYPYPDYPDSNGYGVHDPYRANAQMGMNGYRFRPLDERERTQTGYPGQYADQYARPYRPPIPHYPSTGAGQRPAWQATPYSTPPAYADPRQEAYSFRPLEKSPAARGRWQGPYEQPGRRFDSYPTDPWTSPPAPQWGSTPTPPARRMYPSFQRDSRYRLTAR